ncbi:MAG: hypothetical protein OEY72_05470, partial [Gammaproteobacteria bacterium]|nr:hypothetical protein [Gammaproteobacteria bacterium]
MRPHASLAALAPNTAALEQARNSSVRVEILQVLRSDEIAGVPAPDGMEAVVLVTRWENIHPKQSVARAQLEGGADRSFGAGGLLSGGNKPDPKDMVELDVAYKIPQAGLHLWLVSAGETYALSNESADLPNGVGPTESFTVAHFGEQRQARFGWYIPKGSSDLELRFFDYENGPVLLPVAGDAANAARAPARNPIDTGSLEELELMVLGSKFADSWAGTQASAGWRYLIVELLGKSLATQGDKPALVYADPTRYLWTIGDGGYLRYGLPPSDGTNTLSFTPELPHRQSVAFLVPDKGAAYRVGIRGPNGVLSLRATPAEPAAPGVTLVTAIDAGSLELAVLGMHWDDQVMVARLLASPLTANKGVDLDIAQQFLLKVGSSEYRPDLSLTERLFGQPPTPFVLPPGTPVTFELAFSIPVGTEPAALRYRGFSAESILGIEPAMLGGKRGTAAGMLAAAPPPTIKPGAPVAAETVPGITIGEPETQSMIPAVASQPTSGATTASASSESPTATTVAAAPAFVTPKTSPKLMPVVLPPFDPQRVVPEKEPNETIDQATPLGKMLAVAGTLSASEGDDRIDRFSLDVSGEPQLWTVEANGAGLGGLEVFGAGERRLIGADSRDSIDQQSVRIDNLQLLPGRYWVKLTASWLGGDYRLRAAPLGRPERESEFEPNDDPSHAQALRFGEPKRGLISHGGDWDVYRFSLDSDTHLALKITPPPGLKLVMKIQGGALNVTGNRLAKAGEDSVYEALLQAGDYRVTVHSEGGTSSDTPYELRLDSLDPFTWPTDLEPNDSPLAARPLEQVRNFSGSAQTFEDSDWFLLPAVEAPTAGSVRFIGGSGLSLRRIESGVITTVDLVELAHTEQEHTYAIALEPGAPTYLAVSTRGEYSIAFALDPEPATSKPPLPATGLDLAVTSKPMLVAAFRGEMQHVPLSFSVTNRSNQPQQVELETASAADGWRVTPVGDPVLLDPGTSGNLQATLTADADRISAERVPIYVRAHSQDAVSAAVELPLRAECGVPAQSPERDAPLPPTLLGSFNVSWAALGATPVADDSGRERQALLYDGMTPLGQSFDVRHLPADITVKLAGGVVPVAGIALFPTSGSR